MALFDFIFRPSVGNNARKAGASELAAIKERIVPEERSGRPEFEIRLASLVSAFQRESKKWHFGSLEFLRQAYFTKSYSYGPIENVTSVAPGETLELVVKTKVSKIFENEASESNESKSSEQREATSQTELIDKVLSRTTSNSGVSVSGGVPVVSGRYESSNLTENSQEKISSLMQGHTEKTAFETKRATIVTTRVSKQEDYSEESRRLIQNKSDSKTMTVGIRRLLKQARVLHQSMGANSCLIIDAPAKSLKFSSPINTNGDSIKVPTHLLSRPAFSLKSLVFGILPALTPSAPLRRVGNRLAVTFSFPSATHRDAALRLLHLSPVTKQIEPTNVGYSASGAIGQVSSILPKCLRQNTYDYGGQHVPLHQLAHFAVTPSGDRDLELLSDVLTEVLSIDDGSGNQLYVGSLDSIANAGIVFTLQLTGLAVLPDWNDYADFFQQLDDFSKQEASLLQQLKQTSELVEEGMLPLRSARDLRIEEREVALSWFFENSSQADSAATINALSDLLALDDVFLIPDVWQGRAKKSSSTYPALSESKSGGLPLNLYLSLGWQVQLDADARRNELINSTIVRVVIPFKAGESTGFEREKQIRDVLEKSFSGKLSEQVASQKNDSLTSTSAQYIADSTSKNRELAEYLNDSSKPSALKSKGILADYLVSIPVPGHFFDVLE